jgi:putative phosphoesterase
VRPSRLGYSRRMRIGVISDTHNYLDPKLSQVFQGVAHILHAGDIGRPWLILALEQIAPVTAVLGNTDIASGFKETAVIVLGGRKFLIHHILDPKNPALVLRRRIISEQPDVVVFGHTHRQFCETLGGTLYLNPGYAGPQRPNLPRSVAIIECDGAQIRTEFKSL